MSDPKELEKIRERELDITRERIQKIIDAGGCGAGCRAGCDAEWDGLMSRPAPVGTMGADNLLAMLHSAFFPSEDRPCCRLTLPARSPPAPRPGANVILTTKGIDDTALKYFVEAGAIACRRVPKDDLRCAGAEGLGLGLG